MYSAEPVAQQRLFRPLARGRPPPSKKKRIEAEYQPKKQHKWVWSFSRGTYTNILDVPYSDTFHTIIYFLVSNVYIHSFSRLYVFDRKLLSPIHSPFCHWSSYGKGLPLKALLTLFNHCTFYQKDTPLFLMRLYNIGIHFEKKNGDWSSFSSSSFPNKNSQIIV